MTYFLVTRGVVSGQILISCDRHGGNRKNCRIRAYNLPTPQDVINERSLMHQHAVPGRGQTIFFCGPKNSTEFRVLSTTPGEPMTDAVTVHIADLL